ncbi:hypothetical protein SNEBB_006813 [Seison nebaliae]|nr:hypothetical protein SNEBB_006813 [Seison nebaliae]
MFMLRRSFTTITNRNIIDNVIPKDNSVKNLLEIGKKGTIYCGFDPTAPSLQLGNCIPLFTLLRLHFHHEIPSIILIGDTTARIGDPSGKSKERNVMAVDIIEKNSQLIEKQIRQIISRNFTNKNLREKLKIVKNSSWYNKLNILEFYRDIGRYHRMGDMLSRSTIKNRINSSNGLSFIEFSYQLFQSYDWYMLNKSDNCIFQLGGQDQSGNIETGREFIWKKNKKNVFGLTHRLLVDSAGNKIGKSNKNSGKLFLDPKLTSPFDLYQYFRNIPDKDCRMYLNYFSSFSNDQIDRLIHNHNDEKPPQIELAKNFIEIIHGVEVANRCEKVSQFLFGKGMEINLTDEYLEEISSSENGGLTSIKLSRNLNILEIVLQTKLVDRRIDGERFIKNGAVKLNNRKICEINGRMENIGHRQFSLLKIGKKKYKLIEWN